jgi:hypothetical protein
VFIDWLKDNFTEPWFKTFIIMLVVSGLVSVYANYIKIFNGVIKIYNKVMSKNVPLKSRLSKNDVILLQELSNKFSGDSYINFILLLEEGKMYENQITYYEYLIRRFSMAHKVFRNKKLEKAKQIFFRKLSNLFSFSLSYFDAIGTGTIVMFRGDSEKRGELTRLGREVDRSWKNLHSTVAKLHPEFTWTDKAEDEFVS